MTLAIQHNPFETVEPRVWERLQCDQEAIAQFCQAKKITEFALFGSVLRDDFRTDGDRPSDIDVLVVFAPNDGWSLFDILDMEQELEKLFGRKVDLTHKKNLKNPYSRSEILNTYRVIYAGE